MMVRMPTLRMRDGQPAEKLGNLPVRPAFRPHDHVPVIGHDAVSKHSERLPSLRLFQDPLERGIVFLFLKQLHPRIRTVENMINETTLDRMGTSRHVGSLPNESGAVKEKDSRPLFSPAPHRTGIRALLLFLPDPL